MEAAQAAMLVPADTLAAGVLLAMLGDRLPFHRLGPGGGAACIPLRALPCCQALCCARFSVAVIL